MPGHEWIVGYHYDLKQFTCINIHICIFVCVSLAVCLLLAWMTGRSPLPYIQPTGTYWTPKCCWCCILPIMCDSYLCLRMFMYELAGLSAWEFRSLNVHKKHTHTQFRVVPFSLARIISKNTTQHRKSNSDILAKICQQCLL